MSIHEKLQAIQSELKAPKGQTNAFGKYKYRSCEDILEALKPLLKEQGCTLTLSDDIWLVGSRFYVKATATLQEGKDSLFVTAYAREEEEKKGMDGAQVTGAASSYARKYALNGLFLIDDTKDADTMDNRKEEPKKPVVAPKPEPKKQPTVMQVMEYLNAAKSAEELETVRASAMKYTWSGIELGTIQECYETGKAKFTTAA